MADDRLKLRLYLIGLVAASWLTDPLPLLLGLLLAALLAGKELVSLLRRALLATLAFSGTISLSYLGYSWWLLDRLPLDWLIVLNLRVLLMAMLGFLLMRRVNLFKALAHSPRLSYLLVLAMSQSLSLRRTLEEFRLALQSRCPHSPSLRDRYRFTTAATVWLLDRSLANAHEAAQAMQARGFFQ